MAYGFWERVAQGMGITWNGRDYFYKSIGKVIWKRAFSNNNKGQCMRLVI